MLRSVVGETLYARWRAIAGWAFELAAVCALIVAIYPSFAHVHALATLAKSFPASVTAFVGYGGEIDYTTPVGFLGTELFTVMLPLLMLALAIGAGARAIASEEEAATLDLLLANPLSRRRLVIEKAAALALELLVFAVAIFAALALTSQGMGVHVRTERLAAAVAFVFLLALLFGTLALCVGAATGRHGLAVGVPAALAAVAYLVNGVAPLVSFLRGLAKATPFYHYTAPAPLAHGFQADHAAVLLVPALALVAAAVALFERRDLA